MSQLPFISRWFWVSVTSVLSRLNHTQRIKKQSVQPTNKCRTHIILKHISWLSTGECTQTGWGASKFPCLGREVIPDSAIPYVYTNYIVDPMGYLKGACWSYESRFPTTWPRLYLHLRQQRAGRAFGRRLGAGVVGSGANPKQWLKMIMKKLVPWWEHDVNMMESDD